jgi:hypothetical protein
VRHDKSAYTINRAALSPVPRIVILSEHSKSHRLSVGLRTRLGRTRLEPHRPSPILLFGPGGAILPSRPHTVRATPKMLVL